MRRVNCARDNPLTLPAKRRPPPVGLAQAPVPELAKRLGHELVARAAVQGSDLDRLGAVEERADLVQGPYSVGLKHHDHLPMMPGPSPFRLVC